MSDDMSLNPRLKAEEFIFDFLLSCGTFGAVIVRLV